MWYVRDVYRCCHIVSTAKYDYDSMTSVLFDLIFLPEYILNNLNWMSNLRNPGAICFVCLFLYLFLLFCLLLFCSFYSFLCQIGVENRTFVQTPKRKKPSARSIKARSETKPQLAYKLHHFNRGYNFLETKAKRKKAQEAKSKKACRTEIPY